MKSIAPTFSDYTKYRVLEMMTGALVWGALVAAVVLSLTAPLWAIYFIIVFDLYWLMKILYLMLYMLLTFRRFRATTRINWLECLQTLPRWPEQYHLIFIPNYKESLEVLRSTLQSLQAIHYPLNKCLVVLAGEQRDSRNFLDTAGALEREFGHVFSQFLVTVHPADISGEVAGKGANIAWAGRRAQEMIDRLGIPYEQVIVSSFDADTCPHPEYFAYLTYTYLTHPNPTRASFQPLAMFNNNVWEAPAVSRVISYGTTFWLMTNQTRPERMLTFSSHSMSFRALVDVGFWQSDVVSEDSRISLQCIAEYDGAYEVVPLYLPVSMDVVVGRTFWQTLKSQYIQQRRWAYGAENLPYIIWNFFRNAAMPFRKKFRYFFNQIEGDFSWATAPLLILLLGRLPLWVLSRQPQTSVVAQTAPVILQWLMGLATVGLFAQAILSITLLPRRPTGYKKWKLLIMLVQWILLPATLIIFGSVPAIEAQTRLMLGKYLGFHVTEKVRKQPAGRRG